MGPFAGYILFFTIYIAFICYLLHQNLNTDFDKEKIRKEFDSVFESVKIVKIELKHYIYIISKYLGANRRRGNR